MRTTLKYSFVSQRCILYLDGRIYPEIGKAYYLVIQLKCKCHHSISWFMSSSVLSLYSVFEIWDMLQSDVITGSSREVNSIYLTILHTPWKRTILFLVHQFLTKYLPCIFQEKIFVEKSKDRILIILNSKVPEGPHYNSDFRPTLPTILHGHISKYLLDIYILSTLSFACLKHNFFSFRSVYFLLQWRNTILGSRICFQVSKRPSTTALMSFSIFFVFLLLHPP